ncbi:MAG: zinc ribbon domain-containing protein [Eubacteriales bacterium]|nr:zinc ribbon domain-containing protein [Eubacteriales bacterium]
MGKNFLDDLGDALVKTTRDIGKKANKIYEGQKLQTKIAGEELAIEKLKTEIGNRLYGQYTQGAVLGEEMYKLCEKIDQHVKTVEKYKNEAAGLKGCKICPACHRSVDKEAAFCSYCGSPCPEPEQAEEEALEEEEQPFREEEQDEGAEPSPEEEKEGEGKEVEPEAVAEPEAVQDQEEALQEMQEENGEEPV